jgi:hypothetical protein
MIQLYFEDVITTITTVLVLGLILLAAGLILKRQKVQKWGKFILIFIVLGTAVRTISMYQNMAPEQFKAITSVVFDNYMTDEINVKFRKMLTIEQYRDSEIATIFRKTSFDDSLDFQAQLFREFMKQGGFVETDPYILAVEFYSPIFLIFYKFDTDTESLKAAKNLFERHIDHFVSTYGIKA